MHMQMQMQMQMQMHMHVHVQIHTPVLHMHIWVHTHMHLNRMLIGTSAPSAARANLISVWRSIRGAISGGDRISKRPLGRWQR